MPHSDHPRLEPRLGDIRHVHLVTNQSLADALDFYRSWGLEEAADDRNASVPDDRASEAGLTFRGSGTHHHLVHFSSGDHVGLDHIAFEARSRAEVAALHRRFGSNGVELLGEPAPIDELGHGWGFRLRDPEGRVLEVSTEVEAADPRSGGQSFPTRITHIVLNTVDIDLMSEFYTEALGLRVSDWSEHQMVFLRTGRDHHAIAFNVDEHASVNHIAYEVPSLDAFLTSVGRMKRAGVEPMWGIGRHGPGNNSFAYYADPVGFVPEFTSEVMQIDEST
jgi:catechol 2,3-dioxygenase-like lactoylglutathione lyase family enzyme